MSLTQLVSRLEQIESTVSSMFEEQFHDMEDQSILFAVEPLSRTDSHSIQVWLEILQSDFMSEVLKAVVEVLAGQGVAAREFVPSISGLASRLQAVANNLQDASQTWDQIYKARQEVCLVPGGLNKEELLRYMAYTERAKNILLRQIVSAKVYFEEIGAIIERIKVTKESSKGSNLRCPITGQTCDKPLVPNPKEVFVGFQFHSNHYRTSSLKIMITEALERFNLNPFFPDEHYEPVHISCEICHRLQQVSVCIFEISDSNPNVMFELGLAYMLGKVVMLLAKRGSPGTQIADIAGIHRIEYEDLVECRDFISRCLEGSAMILSKLETGG